MSTLPALNPIRTILVASDLSPASLPAAQTAAILAKAAGAELHLVHALPSDFDPRLSFLGEGIADKVRSDTERQLQELAARLPCGAETLVRVEVKPGNPVDVVLEDVQRIGADLLVVGTHGRTGLVQLALGSVAEHLAQNAPVEVLLVRRRPDGPFRRPLLALNATTSAFRAASRVVDIARLLRIEELHVASAYQLPSGFAHSLREEDEVAERMRGFLLDDLEPACAEMRRVVPDMETHVHLGSAVNVVLDCASNHGSDVVFLGSHNRPRWTSMLLGDTARALTHKLGCAVWLVRDMPQRHPLLHAIASDLGLE